ncbi:serine hydrolase domain-containing protein [Aurantiacibacter rhizosphaerae]|uniref:Serine hydrolase n=1 Tax=Aurantiacibacter rhizosphaerae TaxID=2691582 RepID=A0A844XH53_9SPHN|nr:serine hydrolase [Aurantiacibacter rhizosphaerae]MWV28888.1 serine hydrolase [Aurantiacibacter rhizosphaerae]
MIRMTLTALSAAAVLGMASPATAQDAASVADTQAAPKEAWQEWDVAEGCRGLAPLDDAPQGEALNYRVPSPATVAMRRQLLNPQVNSFTFREADEVFANRPVPAADAPRTWTEAEGFTMPGDYQKFAYDTHTDALMVVRDGKILFEDYRNRFDPEQRHTGFSMSKTIIAMLVGQALDRGEIASIDDLATDYWPALKGGGYDGVTIRNLLEMRSGADIEERYDFGDNPSLAGCIHDTAIVLNRARFADFAIDVGRRSAPGAEFNYATLDTAVLGRILEEVSGKPLEQITQERLWQPVGAQREAFWLADGPPGTGRALAGMGFNATLRDFGLLGQLLLDNGVADGVQVLPEGWVKQMTTMRPLDPETPFPGYAYQTWKLGDEPDAYSAVGLAGQYIYVHPQTRTVIVKLSHYPPAADLAGEVADYFAMVANTPMESSAP